MFHNLIWDVEVVSILDKSPARFATTGIAAEGDVRFKIWDKTVLAVLCLNSYGLEEEIHSFHETLLHSGCACDDAALPEAVCRSRVSIMNKCIREE